MRNSRAAGMLALALSFMSPLLAQSNTGIISGRVTDPSGATVPNAQISVVQTDTNAESLSASNSEGLFRVPSLQDGPYRVTVTASGFKKQIRDGLSLRIGENLNLDLKLEVGSSTESIEVNAAAALLDTQTSSTGQVMEGDYFYKLPNNQHWEKGVLYYTPQVSSSNAPWPGALGNWNINGANSYQTAQYEDGIIATSMDGGTTLNSVSVGVEEIKVLTSAMPAEYGHATSGMLIVVKKSGTNSFHGEGGWLFKNTSMNDRRFFQLQTLQQQTGSPSTFFQLPDFVVSGPVVLPKIYNGRNKTFFSVAGSYHIDSSSNSSVSTVPTPEELNGDFSAFSNKIYDPASTSGSFAAGNLSRTPFAGNIIPQSRWSAMWNTIVASKPFAAPQSGVGSITPTGPSGNIVTAGTGNYFNLTNQFRVDHNFSQKFKISGSFSTGSQHQPQNDVTVVYAPYDQYQTLNYTIQQHVALSATYTISPTFISETKVGGYRRTANGGTKAGEDYTFALAKTIPNLPANVYVNPISFGLTQGNNASNQLGVGTMGINVNNSRQFNQDFTKVWGVHSIKFGYEYLWQNEDRHDISNARLSLNFSSTSTQNCLTCGLQGNGQNITATGGITLADIMLGYVYGYSYSQQGTPLLPVDVNHSLYVQDDWRIRPNLTLNIGVRYSNETPAHSKFPGGLSVGSLTVPDNYYTTGSVPGVLTCPTGGCVGGWIQPKGFLWNRDNNNFQPRLGFAYSINDKTVIRGGFALNTLDWNLGYTNQNEIGGGSFFNQNVSQPANVYTPLFNINQGVPAFQPTAPLPNGSIPTSASAPSGRPTITVVPANYHNPYTLNWNVSIQRSFKKDYLVEIDYVGLHNVGFSGNYNFESRPWGTGIDPNGKVIDLTLPENATYRSTWVNNTSGVNGTQAYKPYPNLGGVNYQCNCVRFINHSGTIKVEKRYSSGLSFLTFATWAKGIQNAPGNLFQDDNLARAVSGTTQKYRFVSSFTYELPFGRGKRFMNTHGRLMDTLLGGYSLAWNYSVWAPTPVSLSYSNGTYVNPVTGAVGARQNYPNYEPDPGNDLYLVQNPKLRDNWQDIGPARFAATTQNPLITNCGAAPILGSKGETIGNNCIQVAPSFTRGNAPTNYFIAQRIIGANASITKDFTIKERFKTQLRMDFYNPFKWYNWSNLNAQFNQTAQANPTQRTFATTTSDFGDSTEGGPPQIQLAFRVRF